MTAAALPQKAQPYEVPEGGLASFLTSTVGDWSDEALNSDNYYDIVKPTADQLAAFGREEDDRIAHVATGETVIPMAVFEEDPALKEVLFSRMRDMGIDPERYVVGNQLNSINPVTGQPEFFLKKIFKGIKKAVKGVVKVFKKIAPIVLSTVGFMIAGPIGSALGSGIGTLIQGGDLKDAFKSAAIAGVTAGIGQGISQGYQAAGQAGQAATFGEKLAAGAKGFGESISGGLSGGYTQQLTEGIAGLTGQAANQTAVEKAVASAAPSTPVTATDAVQQATAGAQPNVLDQLQSGQFTTNAGGTIVPKAAQPSVLDQLQSGQFTTNAGGTIVPKAAQPSVLDQLQSGQFTTNAGGTIVPKASMASQTAQPSVLDQIQSGQFTTDASGNIVSKESLMQGTGSSDPGGMAQLEGTGSSASGGINAVTAVPGGIQQNAERTFFQKIGDYMRRGGQSPTEIQTAISKARSDTVTQMLKDYGFESLAKAGDAAPGIIKAAEAAAAKAGPGILARFGPSALALTGLASAAGAFEQPEMEDLPDPFGGNTGMSLLQQYPEKYGLPQPGQYYQPIAAAKGGEIDHFPRKNGPINGPGTGTSDDIPAMLSDGEFVMTARAVRGAGNGSRQAGMNRMYDMMRKFEGGAARGN